MSSGPVSRAANLLLVGSTGQGKSTLGNFLLKPDLDHIWGAQGQAQTFRVGESRESCTQTCAISLSCDGALRIMDTPGLNESHERDLHNMIDVVKAAHELGKVHAVVLVMKMESRMDQTYKDTVLYYHKLFGKDAFASNLIIVHPDFKLNSRKYKDQPQKLQTIREQTTRDVRDLLALPHEPPVICCDSLPEDEESLKVQLSSRSQILEFACVNKAPAELGGLKVPKTEAVKKTHNVRAAWLEGEKKKLEEDKARRAQLPDVVQCQVDMLNASVSKLQAKATDLQSEIDQLDTKDLCEVCRFTHTVVARVGNHAFFHLVSPVKIQDVTRCTGGGASDYHETFRGEFEVAGHFSRGMGRWFEQGQLRVVCWGYKRDYHANDIQKLRTEATRVKDSLQKDFEKWMQLEKEYGQWLLDVKTLDAKIREKKVEMERLRNHFFDTVEEAERMACELALGPDRRQSKL